MAVNWGQINDILGSNTTQTALGILGAALKSKSEADARDQAFGLNQQQVAQNAAQFRAQLLNNQLNANRADRTSRAEGVLQNTRLGENENFATKQRLLRALMGSARNVNITPSDPGVAAAMPQITGGLRLPEGGLPPELLAALSEGSIANAIANRQHNITNLDQDAAIPNMRAMGLPARNMMMDYRNSRAQGIADEETNTQAMLMKALEEDALGSSTAAGAHGKPPDGYEYDDKTGELKKKGTAWWKKALAIGGSIAAAIATGGASIPVQMAVQGAVGAGTGALIGGKKGALMGGLTGATGPLLGGALRGATTSVPGRTPPYVPYGGTR